MAGAFLQGPTWHSRMVVSASTGSIKRFLHWVGAHERHVLIAFVLAATSVWGFVELSGEVLEGETASVDERLLLSMRSATDLSDPVGPRWVEEMARDITGLGGVGVLTFVTLAAAGALALQRKGHMALYLLLAIGSGIAISMALKAGFSRPRPDLVPHRSYVYTSSFPSGHAMMSAITFLTMGALLAGTQESRKLKAYFLGIAAFLALVVGISRVYLGVHWPTDVLGGWAAGAGWALLCWAIAERLRARGKVE